MGENEQRLENIEKKLDRVLSWAEGDSALGTPSIKDQIDYNGRVIDEAKKKMYNNENRLNDLEKDVRYNSDHIKDQKRVSAVIGGGSGGGTFVIIEIIRRAIGM